LDRASPQTLARREFLPSRYKEFKAAGILERELREAARRTADEMDSFMRNGFAEHEAWEYVREEYLFPPPEPALKAKWDREPVASEAARTFNSIARLKSALKGE
jgi:hypothetical protein